MAQVWMVNGAGVDGKWRRCGKRVGTGATGKPESTIRGAGLPHKITPAPRKTHTCAHIEPYLRPYRAIPAPRSHACTKERKYCARKRNFSVPKAEYYSRPSRKAYRFFLPCTKLSVRPHQRPCARQRNDSDSLYTARDAAARQKDRLGWFLRSQACQSTARRTFWLFFVLPDMPRCGGGM